MSTKLPRQLFVTRLHWTTCKDALKAYFSQFGKVVNTKVVIDFDTGFSKGYGFVQMNSEDEVDRILEERHVVDQKEVVIQRDEKPR